MALIFALLFRSTKDSDAVIKRSTVMKNYTSSMRSRSGRYILAGGKFSIIFKSFLNH